MRIDDDSLDATLDRYMGQASAPPAGQVESSVDAVWERLRSEADCAMVPAREIVSRRSHFPVVAAVFIATVATGLYTAQRSNLLPARLPIRDLQQPTQPQLSPAIQSQATSVNPGPAPGPATTGAVAVGSKERAVVHGAPEPSGGAASEVARLRSTDAEDASLQSVGAAFPAMPTRQIDGKYSQGTTTTAPLAFEVASIRRTPPPVPTGGGPWTVSNGRFRAERGFLRGVIGEAYGVLATQVKGGSDWIDREPYDFDARAGNPGVGPDQLRAMLRTLLADRFKLMVHRETEQSQVYTLTVGQSGSKLQDAKDGNEAYINWTGLGQVTFSDNPHLGGLINILSSLLGSPVLDRTGISGSHDFSLSFTRPGDPRPRQADSPPDLITAVREQLGLELQATKRQVEIVVIDRIEKPQEN